MANLINTLQSQVIISAIFKSSHTRLIINDIKLFLKPHSHWFILRSKLWRFREAKIFNLFEMYRARILRKTHQCEHYLRQITGQLGNFQKSPNLATMPRMTHFRIIQ